MLIFGAKHPRWGTVKPRQYDLKHAQYSVARNAEAMGIDAQSLNLFMPFWEKSGLFGSIVGDNKAANNTDGWTWGNNGISLSDGNHATTENISYGSNYSKFTVWGTVVLRSLGKQGFLEKGALTREFGIGTLSSAEGIKCYMRSSSNDVRTTEVPQVGVPYSFCVTYNGNETPGDRIQILINGSQPSYAVRDSMPDLLYGDITPLTIGSGPDFSSFAWQDIDGIMTNLGFAFDYYGPDIGMQLTDTPYALLEPVSQPIYFDFGAVATTPWAHKLYGVSPAKINGIPVANIAKVGGA